MTMAAAEMGGLFEDQAPRPLADRLRPTSLAEVLGQDHLIGAEGPIDWRSISPLASA